MLHLLCLIAIHQIQVEEIAKLPYRRGDLSVSLRRIKGTEPMFYQSKMSCDVDGSPNAYNPIDDRLALDDLVSAGGARQDGKPDGAIVIPPQPNVVVYVDGQPFLQPSGRFKGFYVSETSLQNDQLPAIDPKRYLDARTVQYVVLPDDLVPGMQIGDVAMAYDPLHKKKAFCVCGDEGGSNGCGEASLATIRKLGYDGKDGRSSALEGRRDVLYLFFPGSAAELSATGWPIKQRALDRIGDRLFEAWGGDKTLEQIGEW